MSQIELKSTQPPLMLSNWVGRAVTLFFVLVMIIVWAIQSGGSFHIETGGETSLEASE